MALIIEAHNCELRNTYLIEFDNGYQAIEWIKARESTHVIAESEEHLLYTDPALAGDDIRALVDYLYPRCEHGLSASLCSGYMHYSDTL